MPGKLFRCSALCLCLQAPFVIADRPVDELDVIVVTATSTERKLGDTPQPVTIIDRQQIAESTAHSTPDLLERTAGVYIQKTNLGGGSAFIRGLTGKQMLILIDGVRLNNSFYRFGPHQYLNTLDPNVIERIEVVRGPSSVLYGTDALGGTINIITRRRSDFAQRSDVDAGFDLRLDSAVDGGAASLLLEGNHGDTGWLTTLMGKEIDDLDQGRGGEQVPSGYREGSGFAKLHGSGPGDSGWTFATHYLRQWDVPKTSEVTLGSKLKFDYEPQELSFTYVEFRTADVPGFDETQLILSLNRQVEGEEIVDQATPNTESREVTRVTTPGFQLHFKRLLAQRHRITLGAEAYRDSYDTRQKNINRTTGVKTAVNPGVPDGTYYYTRRAFLQDEFSVNERLELIGGLSYNHFKTEGRITGTTLSLSTSELTGAINALYRLTPAWSLVGGYAQGFRAPNIEDFFGRVDFATEIPNTQLEPESARMVELGIKHLSRKTYAEFFVHRTRFEDLITRVTVAPGVRQRQNASDAVIHGAEFLVRHQLDREWSASLQATWTWGQDTQNGQPLRRIPPLNGAGHLRREFGAGRWAELELEWARRQERLSGGDISDARIGPGGTSGYLVPSLEAGIRPRAGTEITVRLENLFDKRYKTHGSGLFAPGRSILLRWQQSIFHDH